MSSLQQTVEMLWVDESGRPATTKLDFPISYSVQDCIDAIEDAMVFWPNLTNAGLTGAKLTIPLDIDTFPATAGAGFNTAMDKARFRWSDSGGNRMAFSLPAPVPGIINANDYTVNDTQGDVEDLIAWVELHLNSPYGMAITGLIDAIRNWRNRKSKNT